MDDAHWRFTLTTEWPELVVRVLLAGWLAWWPAWSSSSLPTHLPPSSFLPPVLLLFAPRLNACLLCSPQCRMAPLTFLHSLIHSLVPFLSESILHSLPWPFLHPSLTHSLFVFPFCTPITFLHAFPASFLPYQSPSVTHSLGLSSSVHHLFLPSFVLYLPPSLDPFLQLYLAFIPYSTTHSVSYHPHSLNRFQFAASYFYS